MKSREERSAIELTPSVRREHAGSMACMLLGAKEAGKELPVKLRLDLLCFVLMELGNACRITEKPKESA